MQTKGEAPAIFISSPARAGSTLLPFMIDTH